MAIIGDGRKRNYGLLLLLIVLLAVAVALTWNVYSRKGEPLIRPPVIFPVTTLDTAIVPTVDELMGERKWGPPPQWHASATCIKSDVDKFDVTITPIAHGGGLIDLTSYQVFLLGADGKNEQDITAQFARTGGLLKASIAAKGGMQLRIRLHRDLSTFEFTQKLPLK